MKKGAFGIKSWSIVKDRVLVDFHNGRRYCGYWSDEQSCPFISYVLYESQADMEEGIPEDETEMEEMVVNLLIIDKLSPFFSGYVVFPDSFASKFEGE